MGSLCCRQRLFYDGRWKDGKQHGAGFVYTANGQEKFIGKWENGEQKFMRRTTFREMEQLQFYKLEGEIEVPEEDAGPYKPSPEEANKPSLTIEQTGGEPVQTGGEAGGEEDFEL